MINDCNVVIVGFMGSGKTTISKILAKKLNKSFIDTDHLIESIENISIAEMFNKYGEKHFRNLEKNVVAKLKNSTNSIISTGGGTFCNQENIDVLKSIGFTFYLKTSYNFLLQRFTEEEIAKRPLLSDINNLKILLTEREKYYIQAKYCFLTDNQSPEDIANQIIEKLNV